MKRNVTIILGKTGYGKTLMAKLLTLGNKRLMVYDPAMEWPKTVFLNAQELKRFWVDLSRAREKNYIKRFRVGVIDHELTEGLGSLSYIEGNNTLVLEECHMLFPRGKLLPKWATDQIFYGRHRAVNLMFLSQRASSIPIDLRSQANRVITFNQHEPDDMRALQAQFGRELVKNVVTTLPPLECLDYTDDGIKRYSIRKDVENKLQIKLDTTRDDMINVGNSV